jgi:hypothetical protein
MLPSPYQEHHGVFWAIVVGMFALSAGMIFFLNENRWI